MHFLLSQFIGWLVGWLVGCSVGHTTGALVGRSVCCFLEFSEQFYFTTIVIDVHVTNSALYPAYLRERERERERERKRERE